MGWEGVLVKDSKASSTLVCSAPFCSPCGEALVRLKNIGLVGASKSFAQGQDLIRRRGLNFICFWTKLDLHRILASQAAPVLPSLLQDPTH